MDQQDDIAPTDETTVLETKTPPAAVNEWCCMYQVLSPQDDFLTEKPLIQSIIEAAGHVCLFLPRFHCELNAIEMLWGYAKYCELISSISCVQHAYFPCSGFRNSTDGRFPTAKLLVPQCLDLCPLITIRCFFQKTWRYMDAYRYVHNIIPYTGRSLR